MSDNNITKGEILQLLTADGRQCREIYRRCRAQFVSFLKAQQLDWKIGKQRRRSDLFHQALSLVLFEGKAAEISMEQVKGFAQRLYADRYPDKDLPLDRDDLVALPTVSANYFMEVTQLEERINALDEQQKIVLNEILVAQKSTKELAKSQGKSIAEIQGSVLAGIRKIGTELPLKEAEWQSVEIKKIAEKQSLFAKDKRIKTVLEPLTNSFLALSSLHFEEKMNYCEQIRKDEKKLRVLQGNNELHQRETYWNYRKKMTVALVAKKSCTLDQAIALAPTAWTIFKAKLDKDEITAPLEQPLAIHLEGIYNELLDTPLAERSRSQHPAPQIAKWEKLIATEEEILDRLIEKDQRYLSKLVKELEPEFSNILRKVFKLYEPSQRDRPSEIYYRCFAEVIYKVEKEELTKPLTSTFKTYLLGVGANVYRQEYFKQGEIYSDINDEITENVQEECSIEDKHIAEENAAKVGRYLGKIGDPCKSLIEMRFLNGFAYQVIAERVGKKEGALRTQLSRCMEKLRKLIFK